MGEFKGSDKAGLLVQAAEVTGQVDDGVLFLESFIGQCVIEVVEGLFDLVGIVGADVLVIGIVQQLQDRVGIGTEFLHIHGSVLLVVGGEVKAAVGVELLEFDLGLEAVLGFHYHFYQFVAVNLPLFDTTEMTGTAFIVDDEWHNAVAQALLTFIAHIKLPIISPKIAPYITFLFSYSPLQPSVSNLQTLVWMLGHYIQHRTQPRRSRQFLCGPHDK